MAWGEVFKLVPQRFDSHACDLGLRAAVEKLTIGSSLSKGKLERYLAVLVGV